MSSSTMRSYLSNLSRALTKERSARIVALGEVNLLILAVQGAPSCDATLEGSADAVWKNFRADFILEVLEDRHRHHARDLQHLQNPGPDIRQRVGAGSPCSRLPSGPGRFSRESTIAISRSRSIRRTPISKPLTRLWIPSKPGSPPSNPSSRLRERPSQ